MANSDKNISSAVIKRLPRYFRYLGALKAKNITRISSKELSEQMMVTASQIRQDLNNFGGFGQQGYGYNVDNLYTEIGKILGLDKRNDMIIVGAGNLGQALANYQSFNEDYGYKVMALFDVNPKLRRIRHLRSQRRWQNGELKDSGILHRSIFIYQIMLQ